MSQFSDDVHRVVRSIPTGRTMSYSEVAISAGYPGAARAVGSLMAKNTDPSVPCHRVIRVDGTLGQYNRGGERVKREMLTKEGAI